MDDLPTTGLTHQLTENQRHQTLRHIYIGLEPRSRRIKIRMATRQSPENSQGRKQYVHEH